MEVLTLAILIRKQNPLKQESRDNHTGPPAFHTKVQILMKVETTLPLQKGARILQLKRMKALQASNGVYSIQIAHHYPLLLTNKILCVNAYVISSFGAATQKVDQRTNGPTDQQNDGPTKRDIVAKQSIYSITWISPFPDERRQYIPNIIRQRTFFDPLPV